MTRFRELAQDWIYEYNAADPRGGGDDYVERLGKLFENVDALAAMNERSAICNWLTDMVAREHFSDEERRMVTAIVQNIVKDVHRRHASRT